MKLKRYEVKMAYEVEVIKVVFATSKADAGNKAITTKSCRPLYIKDVKPI